MTEARHERVLRGIPRWLLRGYLEDLGARLHPEISPVPDQDSLMADGWQARLTQLDDYRIGSLSSGQVELVVTGEPSAVEAMLKRLEPRLFRGGG
jgi:hypothetical protein